MTSVPAFANCHSHVFHRALRGRVTGADTFSTSTFWSWRDRMYALAGVLDPDLLFDLARATYAEMHLAGIRSVGEFHYVHHQSDGRPYDEPNAMGEALLAKPICASHFSTRATSQRVSARRRKECSDASAMVTLTPGRRGSGRWPRPTTVTTTW